MQRKDQCVPSSYHKLYPVEGHLDVKLLIHCDAARVTEPLRKD